MSDGKVTVRTPDYVEYYPADAWIETEGVLLRIGRTGGGVYAVYAPGAWLSVRREEAK